MPASNNAWRLAAIAAAALAAAAAVVLTLAPAALLARAASAWSGGHVELADATGTVWSGEADLVLSSANPDAPLRAALPGRTAWQLRPWRLLLGTVDLTLSNASAFDVPLSLRVEAGGSASADADRLRLPAQILAALGAPWNTVRPGGTLWIDWGTLHLQGRELRGALGVEWAEAASALSPVVPFGHYRLHADGIFDGAQLQLETLAGPMEMSGSGTIATGGQLRFRGMARVMPGTDAAVATQLSGLVSLLGRRDGDAAILSFGS